MCHRLLGSGTLRDREAGTMCHRQSFCICIVSDRLLGSGTLCDRPMSGSRGFL
ncbi:MAG: hypothetical protein F6K28_62505 [Microcoleus sp. SIO2G3]|nr:hypothetical protein [Microcoleus sp. SIO2G3]